MSVVEKIAERGAEIAGKFGIAGGVTVEAGKSLGLMHNVSLAVILSAAGVFWLLVDRTVRILWDAKERKQFALIATIQALQWCGLIFLVWWWFSVNR